VRLEKTLYSGKMRWKRKTLMGRVRRGRRETHVKRYKTDKIVETGLEGESEVRQKRGGVHEECHGAKVVVESERSAGGRMKGQRAGPTTSPFAEFERLRQRAHFCASSSVLGRFQTRQV
jgi:hypothetical protein